LIVNETSSTATTLPGEDLADVVEDDLSHSDDHGVYTALSDRKQWH
jgi:hypothetical protein